VKLDPSAFVAAPELIETLSRHSVAIVCEEDRILFRQGDEPDGVYLLQTGSATLQMAAPDGHSIVTVPLAAGSLVGIPGVVGNKPYTLTAIAYKGARIGYISRNDFTALMHSEPMLSLKILQVLAAEVSSARRALVEM
jgi:CRP-like cAMP-binding protein